MQGEGSSSTTPVRAILQGARDMLSTRGWCQRSFRNEQGERCLAGAIGQFARDTQGEQWPWAATNAQEVVIAKLGKCLIKWNDTDGRTKEQVLGLLDEVIADL